MRLYVQIIYKTYMELKGKEWKDLANITESYCIGCGRPYPVNEFYKSKNPHHYNHYLPYCKECCGNMVRYYIRKYGNLESAMWMTCANLGIPFTRRAYNALEKKINEKSKIGKNYNYIGNYVQAMNTVRRVTDEWDDFSDTDVSFGDIQSVERHEQSLQEEMKECVLNWGHQEIEDYQFLEWRYEVYTSDIPDLTPSQESLYRRLCMTELRIRQKDEAHEDTKAEQTQMVQLMKTLHIDDFTNSKEMTMAERIIESQIAWMEEEEPAFHYKDLEKYRDFTGKENYMYNHVLRPLKNLLVGSKEYTLRETKDDIEVKEAGDDPATEEPKEENGDVT